MIIKTDSGKTEYNIKNYAKLITKDLPIKIKKLNDSSWILTFSNKIGWFFFKLLKNIYIKVMY